MDIGKYFLENLLVDEKSIRDKNSKFLSQNIEILFFTILIDVAIPSIAYILRWKRSCLKKNNIKISTRNVF